MGLFSMSGRVTKFGCVENEQPIIDTSVEFEFLDTLGHSECHSNENMELDDEEYEEEEKDHGENSDENRSFWENQYQVLKANILRTNSVESRIRHSTKEALQNIKISETVCGCNRMIKAATTSCRNCLMREVSRRLQNAGYDSAICKTKWRTSPTIPSGEHNFLDVIENTSSKKGVMRVIIEVNFRAEFEMARGNEDYNLLVRRLPEVFVGNLERLGILIKIMCMAAKRCMKERKMHMGPWRKHRYMQAKWLGPCDRNTSTTTTLSMGYSCEIMPMPKPKPKKASMLTIDLFEKLPIANIHCTTLEVL